jgi:hypothetical protein
VFAAPHALLRLLHSIVVSDRAPAGFAGSVCVGVASEDGGPFWIATFGIEVEARFVELYLGDAEVLVLVSEEEAERMLFRRGSPMPLEVVGNIKLLTKFVGRYFATKNLLSVRCI